MKTRLTEREAGDRLGVTKWAVRMALRRGRMKSIARDGYGRRIITSEAVEAYRQLRKPFCRGRDR